MASKSINYNSRDFISIRQELFNFVLQYYPDIYQDLNDASIGTSLIELNAAVSDSLNYNLDTKFTETQLDYAQEPKNVRALAKNLGLNIPGKRPSITIVDFTVTIPVYGDTYDSTYLPIIKTGAQVKGGGKVFETLNDIDFSSDFNSNGTPNILKIPNIDANQNILSYNITKRELVTNGTTQIYSKVVTVNDYKPFLEIILPDDDVISIEQIINLAGTSYSTNPTLQQFLANNNTTFYEVDSLAENKVFVEDIGIVSDVSNIKPGKYISISKKFIKEFTQSGLCKVTFGGGQPNADVFNALLQSINLNIPTVNTFLNNDALGEIPSANSTLFIRYRVGGGADSNIGANILSSLGNVTMIVNGNNNNINQSVIASLSVNNPIPALGGNDEPSIDQIRNLSTYNFSSQNRCISPRDYIVQVQKMDGNFGSPFRIAGLEQDNKIVLSILALDNNNRLQNQTTSVLKNNIANYLSNFKGLNDYLEINDGQIVNLSFEIDALVDKNYSNSEVASNIISTVADYMDINKHDMNENLYLSPLIEEINNVAGVLNVIAIRIFNPTGGVYGSNQTTMSIDPITGEIQQVDFTIFSNPQGMFQVLNSTTDIIIRIKTN